MAALLTLLVGLWLFDAFTHQAGPATLNAAGPQHPVLDLTPPERPADAAAPETAPEAAHPLEHSVGRLVAIEPLEPVRGYARQVLLHPEANQLVGRVLDPTGSPVAGAELLLYRTASGHHGERFVIDIDQDTSDAEGRFALAEDEADWYGNSWTEDWRLSVRAPGHPVWHGIPVAAGAEPDIVLPEALPVRVALRHPDGAPLVGARLREDLVLLGDDLDGERIEPHWTWGTTDARGELDVLLAADYPRPRLVIEHPDHAGEHQLPAVDANGRAALVLERQPALEVEWVGDLDAYRRRGLPFPGVWLKHDRGGSYRYSTPDVFTYSTRREGAVFSFEHLSSEPLSLRSSYRDDATVLLDGHVPAPGRLRLRLPVPALEPFAPGESRWGFTLELEAEGPELGWLPGYVLRSADGTEQFGGRGGSLWGRGPMPVTTSLTPPLTIEFVGWGAEGPRVTGVEPGDAVRLVVDRARSLEWSASVRVDRRHLDDERAAGLRLKVWHPDGKLSYGADDLIGGLAAGSWNYRVSGRGIEKLEGATELVLGQEFVVTPLPAPWPPPKDTRPHDRRDAHGLVVGTITLTGDPWCHAASVWLKPDQEGLADERAQVRGGSFRIAVAPGSYRIERVWLARTRWPTASLAQGFGVEDDHRVEYSEHTLDPPRELLVQDGGRHELTLSLDAGPPRGLVRARVFLDDQPFPTTTVDGRAPVFEADWTGTSGAELLEPWLHLSSAGELEIVLPPGPGRLVVRPGEDLAAELGERCPPPCEVELDVPPPRDERGQPQALALRLDLQSAAPADDAR